MRFLLPEVLPTRCLLQMIMGLRRWTCNWDSGSTSYSLHWDVLWKHSCL